MRFWDTSAIVPLLVDQPVTKAARAHFEEDGAAVVWWGTPVECWSAFARLRREGVISSTDEENARVLLETLRSVWSEIVPSEEVRRHAGRLLRLHNIRAADALQLAAALVFAGSPPDAEFVCFDERLRDTARLEGFTVI